MGEILTDIFITELCDQMSKRAETKLKAELEKVNPGKPKKKPKNLYDAVIQLDALNKTVDDLNDNK